MTLQLGFDFAAHGASEMDVNPAASSGATRGVAPSAPDTAAALDPASELANERANELARDPARTTANGSAAPMPFLLRSPDQALTRAGELSSSIATQLREPVRVAFTDNRRTMLSARRRGGKLEVRLHHMFLDADGETVEAIGAYLGRADAHASRMIDAFIATHQHAIRESRRRTTRIRVSGEVHDLEAMMRDLVERHFGGATDAKITWGRRVLTGRGGRRRKSIQLGTYSSDEQLIRIHPVLDQEWVPDFYVESVIFHELLHHELGAIEKDGRRCFHTPEFRRRERAFECFARSQAWEKANLARLLRGR